jgi:hypothetical protein
LGRAGNVEGNVHLQADGRRDGATTPDKGAGAAKDIVAIPNAGRLFDRPSRLDRVGAIDDDDPCVHAGFARAGKDGPTVHFSLTLRTQDAVCSSENADDN